MTTNEDECEDCHRPVSECGELITYVVDYGDYLTVEICEICVNIRAMEE